MKQANEYASRRNETLVTEYASDHLPAFDTDLDLIYSINLFQHTRKRESVQCLLASRDRLREGGVLYVQVPDVTDEHRLDELFGPGLRRTDPFRMRYFSEAEIRAYLERIGFEDVRVLEEETGLHVLGRA